MPPEQLSRPGKQTSRTPLIVACCCGVLLLALGLAGTGYLWSYKLHRGDQRDVQVQLNIDQPPPAPATELLEPVPVPIAQSGRASSTIKEAMARCDAEAAKDPDGMYFLLTPVVPVNFESATMLLPPGDNYKAFFLIPSHAVLNGLEDGSLSLSMRPYQFSIINPQTEQIQNWYSAMGPSQFTQRNAAAFLKFQIRLAVPEKEGTWTHEYDREKGNCYWINVFFPGQPYAPATGRVNSSVMKSFPTEARSIRCANRACERDID